MELREALESGDPHSFMSSLPVHQDGTCNGLQHYAALGGDDQGAKQVNLSVTDKPSDVYTYVAEMVEKVLVKDAEADNRYAKILLGKVSRKVVKQTVGVVHNVMLYINILTGITHIKVMTTVYGVTFVGAREQIEKQLRERRDIPEEECYLAAAYLAKQVSPVKLSFPYEGFMSVLDFALHRRFIQGCESHSSVAQHLCYRDCQVDSWESDCRS